MSSPSPGPIQDAPAADAGPIAYRIAQHAGVRPDAVALSQGEHRLTYRQLARRSAELAGGLLANGVQAGGMIGVRLPPGPDVVVALLACHRIGAVYVPLDPAWPVAHLQGLLGELRPQVILNGEDAAPLPEDFRHLGHTPASLRRTDPLPPPVELSPAAPSHVFFTSGTTGRPKGVLATQGNLRHYVERAIERFGFGTSDRFLAAARITFSISLFELLVPLAAGGEVRILSRDEVLNLEQLGEALRQATAFHFGPSLLKKLIPHLRASYGRAAHFDGIRHASSGGDFVPVSVLEGLRSLFRKAEVAVIYGSTEISCMGCSYTVPTHGSITRARVGKPFGGVGLELRDAAGRVVAPGEVGEVFISGGGVAAGYLGRPELTRERFTERDGVRWYAMGDLGRLDEEGNLALLGRNDDQVQIRGMRVELPAVEECLRAHPAVADCVVAARTRETDGECILVAWVVPSENGAEPVSGIGNHAAARLPDFMVPAAYVRLEALPLNHNGKLDRSRLPAPSPANRIMPAVGQQPRSELERELQQSWERLLDVKAPGIDADFFALGGDSLAAVSFLAEVETRFGVFIPLSHLLEHPTLREMAEVVEYPAQLGEDSEVVVLRRGREDRPPLFCLYGVMLYRDLARALTDDRMVCGVYVREEVELLRTGATPPNGPDAMDILAIARRYRDILRRYQPQGPYCLCGESFGGVVALEVARMLETEGERVDVVAMLDSHAPGYYRRLPRWRRLFLHGIRFAERWRPRQRKASIRQARDEQDARRERFREEAFRRYRPAPYFGPVLLFRARQRDAFDPELVDLGWKPWLPKLQVHHVEGDHLGILRQGAVETIASRLDDLLGGTVADTVGSTQERTRGEHA